MWESGHIVYAFGPFILDPTDVLLERDGLVVSLKPKVFQLLLILVGRAGHLVTKDELMCQLWPNAYVEEHNLVVHVSELRKALGGEQPYIQTVARHGYRFCVGVLKIRHEDRLSGICERSESKAETTPVADKRAFCSALLYCLLLSGAW
ncbi:MAG TPA: transcriptional regulator [Pyrinomonadaceae bacterium]|nr:transcriptional regulator [Pyrinomonadaceae bacterium]